jgi:hypothetical protein
LATFLGGVILLDEAAAPQGWVFGTGMGGVGLDRGS